MKIIQMILSIISTRKKEMCLNARKNFQSKFIIQYGLKNHDK